MAIKFQKINDATFWVKVYDFHGRFTQASWGESGTQELLHYLLFQSLPLSSELQVTGIALEY